MSDQHPQYQIGSGVPLNQQYLQSYQVGSGTSPDHPSQQQQHSTTFAPPPAPDYNPQAPDIPTGQYQAYHPHSSYDPQGHDQPSHQLRDEQTSGQQPQQSVPIPLPAEQSHVHGGVGVNQVPGALTPRNEAQGAVPYFPPPPSNYQEAHYPPPTNFVDQQQSQPSEAAPLSGRKTHTSEDLSFRPPLPPRHSIERSSDIDPIHYTRDPHRLTAYLIPFPKPQLKNTPASGIPDRFLIYTPPAPPIPKPAEGSKEPKLQKVQRKWQEEVRAAKTSTAKTTSWKGVKSKATRGISKAVGLTTTANLDFLNRVPDGKGSSSRQSSPDGRHADDGVHEDDSTHKTVGLQEMVLVYPASYGSTPEQVKVEFINTMMRAKSKAQRDSVIATGLLPVTAAIDILATVIWPFGGLLEVDGVWAYSSIRGAKTARSVTKRLTSSTKTGVTDHETEEQEMQGDKLHLQFQQDPRIEVLYRYLCSKCTARDSQLFPSRGTATTESEVLESIGWAPSQTGGEKNWEDEQWETNEVKDDLKNVMSKGAREWDKWCKKFAEDPEKALKK
ncbi:hypothetical protein G7Y79_00024g055150 [Physcia stellaris]|nr:hypothetical protein G7Y79_00024g055150 [Physcia stellaris]